VGEKPSSAGREHGVGFDRPSGRLIELGEGDCRAQSEEASVLLLGDGDGGLEGLFSGHWIVRIAFQQDFAAQAVQESVGPVFSCLTRERQRLVDQRQGAFEVPILGFEFGEQTLKLRDWRAGLR
jgi:hypothetical protein